MSLAAYDAHLGIGFMIFRIGKLIEPLLALKFLVEKSHKFETICDFRQTLAENNLFSNAEVAFQCEN